MNLDKLGDEKNGGTMDMFIGTEDGAPLLSERVAALMHELWGKWYQNLLKNGEISPDDGTLSVSDFFVAGWRLTSRTPYEKLPEKIKEEPRSWAAQVLDLIAPLLHKSAKRAVEATARAKRAEADLAVYRVLLTGATARAMFHEQGMKGQAGEFADEYLGDLMQAALDSGAFAQEGVEAADIVRVAGQLHLTEFVEAGDVE